MVPGVLVGRDLLGSDLPYDPFELYRQGLLTNPNMVVIGQIGRGKSAFVKTYLWRQAAFGRRAWVVDPKGEYGALARAWGVEPVALRPGGSIALNPLDAVPSSGGRTSPTCDDESRRRSELLASLAGASLGRALLPTERSASTSPSVAHPMVPVPDRHRFPGSGSHAARWWSTRCLHPAAARGSGRGDRRRRTCRRWPPRRPGAAPAGGRRSARHVRRSHLARHPSRRLAGGPRSVGGVPLRRAGHPDDCATALAARRAGPVPGTTAWSSWWTKRGRSSPTWAVARWLQSSWKLSRALGVSNVAVLHRLSDLDTTGATGSEQVGLAHGLLADSETRVVYAQPPGEVRRAASLLGLSPPRRRCVPHLRRGVALWKVGSRSFLVEHRLSPLETAIVDTDARMEGRG